MHFHIHHVCGNVFCAIEDRNGNPKAFRVVSTTVDDASVYPYRVIEQSRAELGMEQGDTLFIHDFVVPYADGMSASFTRRAMTYDGNRWYARTTRSEWV